MREQGPRPEVRKKYIVEIGSGALPASDHRGIASDEHYFSINEFLHYSHTEKKLAQVNKTEQFDSIVARSPNLPIKDGVVDELIFNNVFGDPRLVNPEVYFSEAVRVLKPGGEIVITETTTPELNDLHVLTDEKGNYTYDKSFFAKFSLQVKSLTQDRVSVEKYRKLDPQSEGARVFQLVLKKI